MACYKHIDNSPRFLPVDFIVLTVSAYPEPENTVADLGAESATVSLDSYRPEFSNAFEVER
jgi:hypothetical protein